MPVRLSRWESLILANIKISMNKIVSVYLDMLLKYTRRLYQTGNTTNLSCWLALKK